MDDIQRVEVLLSKVNDHILTVLDDIFEQYRNEIMHLVPYEYRFILTKGFIRRLVKGSRKVIHDLNPAVKQQIAVDIRNLFQDVEEEYVHSVMIGKPNKDLGLVLQEMGQVHWNGI